MEQKTTDVPSGYLRRVTMETGILGDWKQTQYNTFSIKYQTHWRPIYPWSKVRVVYGVVLKINIALFKTMGLICRWTVQFNTCLI